MFLFDKVQINFILVIQLSDINESLAVGLVNLAAAISC